MQTFTDEQLVAYADGELTPGETQTISTAARTDTQLARRIAQFTESRRLLAETFAAVLQEPAPQRLLDVLRQDRGQKIVPLPRRQRPAWSNWMPMALAASLVLAIGLGAGGLLNRQPGGQAAVVAGLLSDGAALSRALEVLPSGETLSGSSGAARYAVVPLASLRTADGTFCREFESSVATQQQTHRARGVACRAADGAWEMRAVASVSEDVLPPPAEDGFQPASAPGIDVTAVLPGSRRLTPDEEQTIIERNWASPH